MALMRDRQTGKVREVSDRWLARWPDDYVPVKKGKKTTPPVEVADETATAETNSHSGGEIEGEASWQGKL